MYTPANKVDFRNFLADQAAVLREEFNATVPNPHETFTKVEEIIRLEKRIKNMDTPRVRKEVAAEAA